MTPVVVDQGGRDWARLRVSGADRVRFLQGMLTNDVVGLAVGEFCRACLLSVKGRVLAVVDAVSRGDDILLITEAATGEKLKAHLEKHAIVDDVGFELVDLAVHRVWAKTDDVWSAPPQFAPAKASPADEIEVCRIVAGMPRYGADVSEDYFPFEANLERTLSYKKGCYAGQEVVARAAARGQVKKHLVPLRFGASVAPGTALAHPSRAEAGLVTSAAVSPELGPIGLGYVHHSVWRPGTELDCGGTVATIADWSVPE